MAQVKRKKLWETVTEQPATAAPKSERQGQTAPENA